MMRPERTWTCIALALVATLVAAPLPCSSSRAAAQSLAITARTRDALRAALVRYDLVGDGTLSILRHLSSLVASTNASRGERIEAQFLRAAVATDLFVLARVKADHPLEQRVAEAIGVPEAGLVDFVSSELSRVSIGSYAEPARAAREALAWATMPSHDRIVPLLAARGERRDLLLLASLSEVLEGGTPAEREATLARLGSDPCPRLSSCPANMAPFDLTGRLAASTLEDASRAYARLQEAATHGDPFADAARDETERRFATVSSVSIVPALRLTLGGAVPAGATGAAAPRPDALIVVREHALEIGFVPHVRAGRGHVEIFGAGEPLLPATREVQLPSSYRALVQSIPGVSEELAAAIGNPPRSIAIGIGDDVASHVLARVLYTAVRAGCNSPMLFGISSTGDARFLPVRVVPATEEGALAAGRTHVRVRMGGYSVYQRGNEVEVPRVRVEAGLLWDVPGLMAQLGDSARRTPSVEFMGSVSASSVVTAAFAVAPREGAVTFVLPP